MMTLYPHLCPQDAIVAKQSAMADGQSAEAGTAVATGAAGPTQVSFKLVIQSSQCGSIIGKGGSKIKEIREVLTRAASNACR